jgi:acyl-CoA synthetase (AMP-forming)/AMP-acid ligase II
VPQIPADNAILAAWRETLARRGEAAAVLGPDGTTLRTFTGIECEAEALRPEYQSFPAGAVIAVQIGNSPAWPAVLLALFRAGLIPLPVGRHVETGELELALATCHAAAIIRADGERLLVERRDAEPIQWGGPAPEFLKLTSGTTSAPRAIRFRAAQLVADAASICATMGITEADVNFGAIPFSHSYGFSNLLTPLLCRGVTLVATEDRLPRAILHDLARSGATVFPGMPVFFQKLAELENGGELPQLRLCISAGAPLPGEVARRFAGRYGQKIHTFYGASECGGIAYDASEAVEHEEGFVGTAMAGVSIRPATGDEPAQICVQSAAVGDGYFPQTDSETLGIHGFTPSDLVRATPAGLVIVGRSSDVINIAGRKLNPLEVEQRLLGCAGVRQAVVFGVPSALRGEEPVACVAAVPGTDAATVMRFCQAELSQWQRPRDIWLLPEIPVNERGKISRRALAERYLAERSGGVKRPV